MNIGNKTVFKNNNSTLCDYLRMQSVNPSFIIE